MAKKQKDEEKAPDGDLRNNQVRVLTCKCCLVTGYGIRVHALECYFLGNGVTMSSERWIWMRSVCMCS